MNISLRGFKKTLILFFVIFIGIEGSCVYATEIPQEFIEQAKKVLSQRPKTYEDLNKIFDPILLDQAKKQFQEYFLIIFKEEFPKAPHKDPAIIKGYQCLYSKMAYARTLENDKQESEQLTALYQLLAFHKKPIALFNKDLAEKIPDFACESCKKSAEIEVGINNHNGY